jgi:hypothetical protein
MVRILKNMRTRLIDDGILATGSAPSYFIEGLLYNVPNDKFGTSYEDTFVAAVNWILTADRTQFVTPSGQHYFPETARQSAGRALIAMAFSTRLSSYGTTGLNGFRAGREPSS